MRVTGNASIAAPAQFTVDGRGYPIGEDRAQCAGSRYSWGGPAAPRRQAVAVAKWSSRWQLLVPLEPTAWAARRRWQRRPRHNGGGAIRLIVDGTDPDGACRPLVWGAAG